MEEITTAQVIQEQDEEEIDLRDLFFMLLSKLKWIVIFGIVGGLIAGGVTHHFIAPKYEATAKIYVVSTSSDSVINLSDLNLGTSLTADYKELLMSRPMLESIIENLGLTVKSKDGDKAMSAETLSKMIEVSNTSGTRILTITATSTDPEEARDIANEMATLSKTWLSSIMDSRQPNIVEKAVTPEKKSSPSTVKNTVIGGFGLAILYCAVVIVMYLMDDTIHSSDEFEKYFGMVPMAVIPESAAMNDEKKTDSKSSSKKGKKGGKK